MKKINCWEFKKCGREPGGSKVAELGVCPTAQLERADGLHGGAQGGRVCWVIAGTFCHGEVQGTFVAKVKTCINCDFYQTVCEQEDFQLMSAKMILEKLK